jgi:hypothetical protein
MFFESIHQQLLGGNSRIKMMEPLNRGNLESLLAVNSPLREDDWDQMIIPIADGGVQGGHWVSYVLKKNGNDIEMCYLNSIFQDERTQQSDNSGFADRLKANIFTNENLTVKEYEGCLSQKGDVTCGIYSLINATNCVLGIPPEHVHAPTTEEQARRYALNLVNTHFSNEVEKLTRFVNRQFGDEREQRQSSALPLGVINNKRILGQVREMNASNDFQTYFDGLNSEGKQSIIGFLESKKIGEQFYFDGTVDEHRAGFKQLCANLDRNGRALPLLISDGEGDLKLNSAIYESYDVLFKEMGKKTFNNPEFSITPLQDLQDNQEIIAKRTEAYIRSSCVQYFRNVSDFASEKQDLLAKLTTVNNNPNKKNLTLVDHTLMDLYNGTQPIRELHLSLFEGNDTESQIIAEANALKIDLKQVRKLKDGANLDKALEIINGIEQKHLHQLGAPLAKLRCVLSAENSAVNSLINEKMTAALGNAAELPSQSIQTNQKQVEQDRQFALQLAREEYAASLGAQFARQATDEDIMASQKHRYQELTGAGKKSKDDNDIIKKPKISSNIKYNDISIGSSTVSQVPIIIGGRF